LIQEHRHRGGGELASRCRASGAPLYAYTARDMGEQPRFPRSGVLPRRICTPESGGHDATLATLIALADRIAAEGGGGGGGPHGPPTPGPRPHAFRRRTHVVGEEAVFPLGYPRGRASHGPVSRPTKPLGPISTPRCMRRPPHQRPDSGGPSCFFFFFFLRPQVAIGRASGRGRGETYRLDRGRHQALRSQHGRMPEVPVVLVATGCGRRWPDQGALHDDAAG